ncbi:MAG: hypothetical protein ACNA7W_03010, partial [Pseudomonadales bacterium]
MTAATLPPGAARGAWRSAAPALALSVAGMMVAGAMIWFQMVEPARSAHSTQLAAAAADRYAGLFDARIVELRAQLEAAAAADSTTEALASGEPAQLARAGLLLTQIMPFADRVEIVAAGSASVDLDADVPISYAALRVIQTAETAGMVGPEGVRLEPQGSRLFAARSIDATDATGGVLFVALSPEYLLQPLRAFHGDGGRVTLTQSFEGSPPLALLQWGDAGAGLGPALRRPLLVPHWHLEFEPVLPAATPQLGVMSLATALAAGLGLALGGILLTVSGFSRTLLAGAAQPSARSGNAVEASRRPLSDGSLAGSRQGTASAPPAAGGTPGVSPRAAAEPKAEPAVAAAAAAAA